jgi:hypothetical protein
VSISLGKDCSISVNGSNIVGARNASISYQLRTVEIKGMDTTNTETANVGLDCVLNFETNDQADIPALVTSMQDRSSTVSVSAGSGGFGFTGIVANITENFSVDGVSTFTVEVRQGRSGL